MGETGLFSLAQVCTRPCLSSVMLLIPFSDPYFFAGGSHDKGLDGPLPVPGDGDRAFKGEGEGNRGGVGGAEDLEGGPGN